MFRHRLLTLCFSALIGCSTPDPVDTPDTPAAEASGGPVEIRILNASRVDFDAVMVKFPLETKDYGPLKTGELSHYQTVSSAYRYAYAEMTNGDELYVLQPIDFVGESLLTPGHYTYEITVNQLDKPAVGRDKTIHGYAAVTLKVDR